MVAFCGKSVGKMIFWNDAPLIHQIEWAIHVDMHLYLYEYKCISIPQTVRPFA